jgi:hypothetical protein
MANEVVLKPNSNNGVSQISQNIPASPVASPAPTAPPPATPPNPPKSTKFPNKIPKTACATPYPSLIRELVFTYLQREYSSTAQMARIMHHAKKKGLIKNPKEFRKWMLKEICKSINAIDKWIQM